MYLSFLVIIPSSCNIIFIYRNCDVIVFAGEKLFLIVFSDECETYRRSPVHGSTGEDLQPAGTGTSSSLKKKGEETLWT